MFGNKELCDRKEMINYTNKFTKLTDKVLKENKEYFLILDEIKKNDIQKLKIKILKDYDLSYEQSHFDLSKIFENHIKEFILNKKEKFSINTNILKNISKQVEIDYLLKKISKTKAQFYNSISSALIYYGIYRENKIVSFQDEDFWKELIKKLYLLNLMNTHLFIDCCNDDKYTLNHPDFNQLPRLIEAKKNIEEKLKEEIDIIDTIVVFKKGQEERIVKKIEKKLSQLHLFNFLRFIFNLYEDNKRKHNIELTIPYKYIVNILVKNISKSKHKNNDKKKIANTLILLNSFISLYQLKENKFDNMHITEHSLVEHLKKQVLYTNFYPIYALKTNTLIDYIEYIVKPSIQEELFFNKFGFSFKDLVDFFQLLDTQTDNIVIFDKGNIQNNELKILELFSINANDVNQNYTSISNLANNRNIFTMNPIIKYKDEFYVIGFKYFKMNFYNTLVEKIRINLDKKVNDKIGKNVEHLVENIFQEKQSNYNYEIFLGDYKISKKIKFESDLILRDDKNITLIEIKNKYLTGKSFSASKENILKDLIFSFVTSQKQLLIHEQNLKNYKSLKFIKDKRELIYENQNIVKISVSTNNWFNIMNNIPQTLLLSLIKLRFNIKEDKTYENKKDFIKANKYLDELQKVITELYKNENFDMRIVLNQTLFLPLELIVDKYNDNNFIECLKSLVGMKMNTDNIMNIYDYCQYLESHNKA